MRLDGVLKIRIVYCAHAICQCASNNLPRQGGAKTVVCLRCLDDDGAMEYPLDVTWKPSAHNETACIIAFLYD